MGMREILAFGVIVAGGLNDIIGVRDEFGGGFFLLRVGWWGGRVEMGWEEDYGRRSGHWGDSDGWR